jgi:hypothetical protein
MIPSRAMSMKKGKPRASLSLTSAKLWAITLAGVQLPGDGKLPGQPLVDGQPDLVFLGIGARVHDGQQIVVGTVAAVAILDPVISACFGYVSAPRESSMSSAWLMASEFPIPEIPCWMNARSSAAVISPVTGSTEVPSPVPVVLIAYNAT